jgi:CheY-like chemotaxis protein
MSRSTVKLSPDGLQVKAAVSSLRTMESALSNYSKRTKCTRSVTDIRMPVMDGTELVKRVKAMGKYTPAAVSISGFSDLTAREAYDLGIEAQLSKPVARKVLISAVRKSLMEREELWAEPFRSTTAPTLKLQFESLAAALRKKKVLFGRGGFCISSQVLFPEASSIGFELNFVGDGELVCLQGVVRWSVSGERLAGIEITGSWTRAAIGWQAWPARTRQFPSFPVRPRMVQFQLRVRHSRQSLFFIQLRRSRRRVADEDNVGVGMAA